MTSISRGRGFLRQDVATLPKPGPSPPNILCQQLYKEILEMNMDKINITLALLAKQKEKIREEAVDYLLKCAEENEEFVISLMQIFNPIQAQFNKMKKTQQYFKRIRIQRLQSLYEGQKTEQDVLKDNATLFRNYSCLLVAEFMMPRDVPPKNVGYRFLVAPIADSFTKLLHSDNIIDLDLLAVLYIKAWVRWKCTNLESFESFLATLHEAVMKYCANQKKISIIMFLIDMSCNDQPTILCPSICDFYERYLSIGTVWKLCFWTDNEAIKKMFKKVGECEMVTEWLSHMKVSDIIENAPEDIAKQNVPRAIRGTGATDI